MEALTGSVAAHTAPSVKTVLKLLSIFTLFLQCQTAINETRMDGPVSLPEATDFTCKNRALGSYYPDYASMCQKFHLCAKGEAGEVLNLSFLCPEGAAFDERSADCLSSASVSCSQNDTENTSQRSTRRAQKELKNSTPTYKTSFKCSGKKLGRYYADIETSCRLFHLCTPGSTKAELFDFQFLCLLGTAFDENAQRCVEQGKVPCGDTIPKKQAAKAEDSTQLENTTLKQQGVLLEPSEQFEDYEDSTLDVDEESLRKKRSEPLRVERLWKVRGNIKKRSKRAPPPSFDMDNLPLTLFTCDGKVIGGYYADVESGCQMYHVCSQGPDGRVKNFRFLCSNGTIFSQQTRTCQTWYTVDCDSTLRFFSLNEELSRVTEDPTILSPISGQQPQQVFQVQTNQPVSQRRPLQQSTITPVRQQQFIVEDNIGIPQSVHRQQTVVQSTSPPLFQSGFQEAVQTTSSPTLFQSGLQNAVSQQQGQVVTTQTQGVSAGTRSQTPGRVGKRRRVKSRKRIQQQQQQQQQNAFVNEVSTVSTVTPSIAVIDQGSVGFQEQFPGLLEELHVRGRFTQDDETIAREVQRVNAQQQLVQRVGARQQQVQQSPRVVTRVQQTPQQIVARVQQPTPAVNQQQQIAEVQLPSTRISSTSSTSASRLTAAAAAAAAPFTGTVEVFPGFDAFIRSAIDDEQRQRQEFRIFQEQRRLQGEIEETTPAQVQPVEEVIQVTTLPTRRRRPQATTVPTITAIVTEAPQIPIRTQSFQTTATVAEVPQRTQFRTQTVQTTAAPSRTSIEQQTLRTTAAFPTPAPVSSSSAILPTLNEIPLFENVPARPTSRPQFQPVTLTEPRMNLDNFMIRQLSPRPQVLTPDLASQQSINLDGLLLQQLSTPAPASTRLRLPIQHAPWHNVDLEALLLQQQQSRPQSATHTTPSFTQTTQSNANQNALVLQQLSGVPQQISPVGLSMSDVVFLVPAESRLSPSWPFGAQLMQFNTPFTSGVHQFRQRRSTHQVSTPPSQFIDFDSSRLNKAPPRPSIPSTSFSCKGKVMGGYYADVQTDCKMFHICSSGRHRSQLYDFRFVCGNDTVFDQRSQTCSTPEKVKCPTSPAYYPKHKVPEENYDIPVPNSELFRIRVTRAIAGVQRVQPGDIPATAFSCQGRENGRFYADPETNCQLFHLCTEVSRGGWLQEHSFLCPNNTIFDQRSQACDDQTDALNCIEDPAHYGIDEVFSRTH